MATSTRAMQKINLFSPGKRGIFSKMYGSLSRRQEHSTTAQPKNVVNARPSQNSSIALETIQEDEALNRESATNEFNGKVNSPANTIYLRKSKKSHSGTHKGSSNPNKLKLPSILLTR